MFRVHKIQKQILEKLLVNKSVRFTDLKPSEDIENNKFVYHLKKLINAGLISYEDEVYSLTNKGKKTISEFSNLDFNYVISGLNVVWIVCTKKENDKKLELLVYTRMKQPSIGCQGFPVGRILQGETVEEAAMRTLKRETNLKGVPKILGVKHYLTYEKQTKDLLQDKYMYICYFENPTGILKGNEDGDYVWVSEEELMSYLVKPFLSKKDYRDVICLTKRNMRKFEFKECREFVTDF